jgi:hypothetical protein
MAAKVASADDGSDDDDDVGLLDADGELTPALERALTAVFESCGAVRLRARDRLRVAWRRCLTWAAQTRTRTARCATASWTPWPCS